MAKILIVDDESANRDFIATILRYDNHETLEAGNGVEALQIVREECPHLVLVDLWMPEMNGTSFIKHLRADPAIAQTAVALYTASSVDDAMLDFMELSQIHYIVPKPSEPKEVIRVVRLALREYGAQ